MGVEVDELEEGVGKPGTTVGTEFSVLHCIPNTIFIEMWFLTVDPLV